MCVGIFSQWNLLVYSFCTSIKLGLENFEINKNWKNGTPVCCKSSYHSEIKHRCLQKSRFLNLYYILLDLKIILKVSYKVSCNIRVIQVPSNDLK